MTAFCGAAGTSRDVPAVPAATAGAAAARTICAAPASGAVLSTGSHRKAAAAPAVAVRVDQVGYPAGAAKLAEIMTASRPRHPLRWLLIRAGSCRVAASGLARQDLGSWSTRYRWVLAAGFSGVHAPGWYRLGVAGDPASASPWFQIGPAAAVYARPLANALSFYAAERDGPDFIRSALRTAPATSTTPAR